MKLSSSPVECTYANGHVSSIVSVAWSPKGDGQLDNYLEISPKKKPVAIDVAGHAGRSLNGDGQVVVGDAAIDVFGIGIPNSSPEAALAAASCRRSAERRTHLARAICTVRSLRSPSSGVAWGEGE